LRASIHGVFLVLDRDKTTLEPQPMRHAGFESRTGEHEIFPPRRGVADGPQG
jgi:hypothetical protein